MTLIKRKLTVSENKEYDPPLGRAIAVILFAIFGSILLIALFHGLWSCNPTKRAYRGIEKHEPKTVQDTTRLLNRAKTVLKTPAPKVLPGKVTVKQVQVIKKVLDVEALNRIVDSFKQAKDESDIEAGEDCNDRIDKAFADGIQTGCAKCQTGTKDVEEKTDTLVLPDTKCIADLWLANNKLYDVSALSLKRGEKLAEYEANDKSLSYSIKHFGFLLFGKWWFWLIIVGGIVGLLLKVKSKFKILP